MMRERESRANERRKKTTTSTKLRILVARRVTSTHTKKGVLFISFIVNISDVFLMSLDFYFCIIFPSLKAERLNTLAIIQQYEETDTLRET